MAKGYTCELSGKTHPGEGLGRIMVPVSDRLVLEVIPHQVLGPNQLGQGDLSPESAERVAKALKSLAEKTFEPKGWLAALAPKNEGTATA